MDENCLYELARKASATGADRVTGQYREVTLTGRIVRERRIVSKKSRRLPTAMLQGSIFRRSIFTDKKICFPEKDNLVAYDFELVYRFASVETNPGEIVRKTLYNYLIHSDSVIQSSNSHDKCNYYFNNVTIPLLKSTARIVKDCSDKDLQERMIYLVIRNYYSRVLSIYQKINIDEALEISRKMRYSMNSILPEYKTNKYLKPICNGYEQPGSIIVWIMSILENIDELDTAAKFLSKILIKNKYLK